MKEYPIIFNTEMVHAILDGRKTQTRRVIKNVTPDHNLWLKKPTKRRSGTTTHVLDAPKYNLCPSGKVGDHLWVREAYQGPLVDHDTLNELLNNPEKYRKPECCSYRADGTPSPEYYDLDDNLRHGWKPSIFMPRWASRITLEITDVRVERLGDISQEDAKAEGCYYGRGGGVPDEAVTASDHFPTLWESIYGKGSWDANPWVWVIEFKKVE